MSLLVLYGRQYIPAVEEIVDQCVVVAAVVVEFVFVDYALAVFLLLVAQQSAFAAAEGLVE
jgi:hypothetical protein